MASIHVQVLLLAFVLGTGFSSPCSDSKDWIGEDPTIEVDECPQGELGVRCELVQGSSKTVTMRFKPKQPIDHADAVVHGIIAGISLPFIGVNADACANMKCPSQPNEVSQYQARVDILKMYPSVTVDIKYELKKGNETIVCHIIPSRIVKHKSH